MNDWPGANLHRQLLIELLHCEAQGTISVHFELFGIAVERIWDRRGRAEKSFWSKLSAETNAYCLRNHLEPLPKFPSWLYWKHALSGGDKLRFFVHCPAILVSLLLEPEELESQWKALLLHSSIVQRLCHRTVNRNDLPRLQEDIQQFHRVFLTVYPRAATLNLHFETHLTTLIERY